MPEEPEVAFCDLCNTSVPLQDLESGAAVRQGGKTIGACCLSALSRRFPAPAPPSPGENHLLAVALILLVAIAGATIYLEYRMNERIDGLGQQSEKAIASLESSVRSQDELLRGLDAALAETVRKEDIQRILDRLAALEGGRVEDRARAEAAAGRQEAALGLMDRKLADLLDARAETRGALSRLQSEIERQAGAIAALSSAPLPKVEEAAAPAPSGGGGLSPALARQVKRLEDPDPATRFEAVDELLRSKDPEARPFLIKMAEDGDTFVRRLTVEGLRDFRHASCVDALLKALGDPEEIVRDTAWRSLKALTGQSFPFEAGNPSKDARARDQQRWMDWWSKNRDSFGA
ncbi:MAG: hypothetical protein Fur0037_10520 [Planctomycetota bacterium]